MSLYTASRAGCRPIIQKIQYFTISQRYLAGGSKLTANNKQQGNRNARRIEGRASNKSPRSTPRDLPLKYSAEQQRSSATFNSILQRARGLGKCLSPRSPLVAKKLQAVGYRLPVALVLWLLLLSEDFTPYKLAAVEGASMLPTFAAQGDLVINETGAWHRILGKELEYEIGDIIVWRNPKAWQGMSVKRIIGLDGDEVLRFGEYVRIYRDDPSWGITDDPSMNDYDAHGVIDMMRTVTIPKGHIWVEGDNPPFSKDSRHYGPVPKEWIRGRLVARLWPLGGAQLTRERPVPVPIEELAADPQFNVHNLDSKKGQTERHLL